MYAYNECRLISSAKYVTEESLQDQYSVHDDVVENSVSH